MTFPAYSTRPEVVTTQVEGDSDSDAYLVVHGQDDGFRPAHLPAPDWFIAVNAQADYNDRDAALDTYFQDAPDGSLTRVRSDIETIKHTLWQCAQQDASDHQTCSNGGLYCVWDLGHGDFIVGGFDNGGSDIAMTGVMDAMEQIGQVAESACTSHYDVESLLHHDDGRNDEERDCMKDLTQLLLDARPTKTPKRAP